MNKLALALLIPFATLALESDLTIVDVADANPALIQDLKNIFMEAFHAVYSTDEKDWDAEFEQKTAHIFKRYMHEYQTQVGSSWFLVTATQDGQIAGWALFKRVDDSSAILEILCIRPSYWRKGIGKKLVFSICDLNPGISHIALMTRRINPISPHFYESLGFKKTNFCLPEYAEFENLQGYEWQK